jgi:ATP-dependent protease ClpP protease subunit
MQPLTGLHSYILTNKNNLKNKKMAKEILLYQGVNSDSITGFINALETSKNEDIKVRICTPGGSVYYGWGGVAKFQEHKKEKSISVDGIAGSFGAYLCCYAKGSVESLDVSKFVFHRAALPAWMESDPKYFTEAEKTSLNKINVNLRAAIEGVTTSAKWNEVTGVTLDTMFSLDSRIDVELDADQAMELGIVNKINKITPEKKAEIEASFYQIAAQSIELPMTPTASIVRSGQNPQIQAYWAELCVCLGMPVTQFKNAGQQAIIWPSGASTYEISGGVYYPVLHSRK